MTHLNDSVERERLILPAVDKTLARLEGATVFTKLDATSGFWQVPLHKDSQLLTTFITPEGRCYFKRLPFGITSAPGQNTLKRESLSSLMALMESSVTLMKYS